MNGELEMDIEYLKLFCYSAGETEMTTGMASILDEFEAIKFRWIFLS
jgi:hypothetical protein